eukprot:165023_1
MPILIPQSQPGAIPSISASTQRHIMDTQSQTQTQTQLPNIMDARGIGFDTQSQQPYNTQLSQNRIDKNSIKSDISSTQNTITSISTT